MVFWGSKVSGNIDHFLVFIFHFNNIYVWYGCSLIWLSAFKDSLMERPIERVSSATKMQNPFEFWFLQLTDMSNGNQYCSIYFSKAIQLVFQIRPLGMDVMHYAIYSINILCCCVGIIMHRISKGYSFSILVANNIYPL